MEYRADYTVYKKVRAAQKVALNGLDPTDADYSIRKDEFETKIDKCTATMKSLRSNLWQLFENLLGAALIPE